MLQGVCVDSGQSAVLEKGTSYYLFPNGSMHYYVSKFQNMNAHKGCFQASFFQIIEKEHWPEEPDLVLYEDDSLEYLPDVDHGFIYSADLNWRKPGYKSTELKRYWLKTKKTHAYFFHDKELKRCGGCFPLHWFSNFKVDTLDDIDQETSDFDIDFEETVPILVESEPILSNYEQLSLFDF